VFHAANEELSDEMSRMKGSPLGLARSIDKVTLNYIIYNMEAIEFGNFEPVDKSLLQQKLHEYEQRFPEAMRILEVGGVHPSREVILKNPYLPGQPEDVESFTNIGRHCVAVAHLAEKLDPTAVERALVHDANKRYEVMRKKAQKSGALNCADVYSGQAYEAIREKLKGENIHPELLDYLAAAGKETGHNSLMSFLQIDSQGAIFLNPKRTNAEKVVHIADDMTSSTLPKDGSEEQTYYVTCEERMALSDFPNRYAFLFIEGFGFDASGKAVTIRDINSDDAKKLRQMKSYADWQVIVAKMIATDLQKALAPDNKQDPELFLCDRANS